MGLLPDKMGKASLPEPTEDDVMLTDLAASGDSYTSTVRPKMLP